mgnify:FL=1
MINKTITKKDLEKFTKDELIYFILNSGSLWNPVNMIYEKRLDDIFEKGKQVGLKIQKILNEIDSLNNQENYKQFLKIRDLNEEREKLRNEEDKLMKILYGDL